MEEAKHTVEAAEAAIDRAQSGDAVQLISDKERLTHHSGASKFFYRRMPASVRNRLAQKATKRGDTNWGKFMSMAMRWCILGWENVRDGNGNLVEFDPELIDALPADLIVDLQDLIGAKAAEEEDLLGN